jgi:transcriptional regulator with GAF, ATPase, and Fis domain
VFPIVIPPLRNRPKDIPHLARHFAMHYASKMGKRVGRLGPEVLERLSAYAWPGNVRELQNVIERAVILSLEGRFELGEIAPAPPGGGAPQNKLRSLEEVERQHIVAILEETRWRISGDRGAAKVLGMKRTTLEARMKKLGINRSS